MIDCPQRGGNPHNWGYPQRCLQCFRHRRAFRVAWDVDGTQAPRWSRAGSPARRAQLSQPRRVQCSVAQIEGGGPASWPSGGPRCVRVAPSSCGRCWLVFGSKTSFIEYKTLAEIYLIFFNSLNICLRFSKQLFVHHVFTDEIKGLRF